MPEPLIDVRAFMGLRNDEHCWAVSEWQGNSGRTGKRFCFPIDRPFGGNHAIIGQGLTYQEARGLCALTPEIVYLLAVIETADCWKPNGQLCKSYPIWPTLSKVREAIADIQDDRKLRNINGYLPLVPFSVVVIKEVTNEKEELMKYILETFPSPDGSVGDLEMVYPLLESKFSEIVKRKRIKR